MLAVLKTITERGGAGRILVGREPMADRFMAPNTTALRDALEPIGLGVEVWCGMAESDGQILGDRTMAFVGTEPFARSLDGIPLEIGCTKASTTMRHLQEAGAVARWPYGHDFITVLALHPAQLSPHQEAMEAVLQAVLGAEP